MQSPPLQGARVGRWGGLAALAALFLAGLALGYWFFDARRPRPVTGGPPLLATTSAPEDGTSPPPSKLVPAEPETPSVPARRTEELAVGRRNGIVRAIEHIGPSVVTVGVSQYVRGPSRVVRDPVITWYRYRIPGEIQEQRIPAGSGVIVDADGIILTNHHVVETGQSFTVTLADGRTFDAELVGSDPNYDLAVLRVKPDRLPVAEVGNSDSLYVGEWSIALGNPFGNLINDPEPTVTVGVISAQHRDFRGESQTGAIYKDMIQTDAAINPGNSGGPLSDAEGRVIGINTFILTRSGGSEGIGFAIPINTAVRVAREILRYGRARPIFLGLDAMEITPWMAEQLQLTDPSGLLVTKVEPGSPAAKAGIRSFDGPAGVWDIIRTVNGESVASNEQARVSIFGAQVGDVIRLGIERNGKVTEVPLTVVEAPGTRVGQTQ